MILALNLIRDPEEARRFDEVVIPRLGAETGADFEVRQLNDPQPLPRRYEPYSHLLISGSELSALHTPEYQQQVTTPERVRAFRARQ